MKMRAKLLVTCAALAIGSGLASPVLAADMVTKAPVAVGPAWWYEGYAEIGARFNVNDPDKSKLGRFYRYEDLRPGVFGNFFAGWHRSGADPFDFSLWGKNVGWDDQAFGLSAAKPGTYYFDFYWDETPHVYARDARTTFGPIGGNVLSTPQYVPFPPPTSVTNTFVNANATQFTLGIRRDTAAAKGRWTPDDNWDVTADYSHMNRSGTQALGAVTFAPPAGRGGADTQSLITLPKPVDDTTQNANIKAEYAGTSPWGKSFNVAFGYGLSLYNDNVGCGSIAGVNGSPGSSDAQCLTFKNPWIGANTAVDPLWNRYSLPPDNHAQNFTLSGSVGLPFNSRYMGTVQYSIMTQDDAFMTSTINPAVVPAVASRSSLNGDARTTLLNNVLNTQITSELSSTLRYRYYDYHSMQAPTTITGVFDNPDTGVGLNTETAFPVNFNKQNATAQLDYRPWKWLNVGAAYEWERWRRDYGDATDVVTLQTGSLSAITNENAVRAFADVRVLGWSTWRTSVRFGERRFDGDYISPLDTNAAQFRMVNTQNRDSTIVKTSWAIDVTRSITFTPTGGYQLDDYPADGRITSGITKYESWNAGADLTWVITPMAALYASYIHEDGIRQVYQTGAPSTIVLDSRDLNDTFILGGKFTVIPEKLFFNASYTYSRGNSKWSSECGPGGCLVFTAPQPWPVFPDTHNTNQRVDAWAKYMLDRTVLGNAGFFANAQPYVKARVIWEKNSNDSWQNVEQILGWTVTPADNSQNHAVYLGMSNPNYNVVVGMLSFGMKW